MIRIHKKTTHKYKKQHKNTLKNKLKLKIEKKIYLLRKDK